MQYLSMLLYVCQSYQYNSQTLVSISRILSELVLQSGSIYEEYNVEPNKNNDKTFMGPFYLHGLTLIPEWLGNCNHYKVW